MIHFLNFQKSYGSFQALKIKDLSIDSGIYWIKGANGSGKSTLLKAIAGILHFDGDIVLNDSLTLKKHPVNYRKVVNFAEAEPIFPEYLTGQEMINIFAAAKKAAKNQFKYYIDSMDMASFIQHPLGSYSSGMLKKLSLVLAFLGVPKVILLDEPLITLDVESLKILYQWIKKRYNEDGTSFLLSSHQNLELDFIPVARTLLVQSQTVQFIL